MLRGEIWLGVWPNDPEKKPRPLLIISNNFRNQAPHLLDINVLKLTSLNKANGSVKPTNPSEDVVITLKKPTIIRCASIFTIEKPFLTKRIAGLDLLEMIQVNSCLKTVLALY